MEESTTSGRISATRDLVGETQVDHTLETEPQNGQTVAVLLPTYCEAENIESLIREIEELGLDVLIAVVDDSSPDGTADIIKKLQEEYDNVLLLVRPKKLGLGTAIITGFRLVLSLKNRPKYIVTMDADYSHNPQDIPKLIYAANCGPDLVVGSRYCQGGKITGSTWRRRLISRLANYIVAAIISIGVRDYTSGFRCYSRNYVETVLRDLHSQTYEVQIETLKQARMHGFNIKEIPITFVNRKRGKSKLTGTESRAFLTYAVKTVLERIFRARSCSSN